MMHSDVSRYLSKQPSVYLFFRMDRNCGRAPFRMFQEYMGAFRASGNKPKPGQCLNYVPRLCWVKWLSHIIQILTFFKAMNSGTVRLSPSASR